ncbi:hypothetical protein [Legionella micdadei]|uniref:Uncharacterized protein n=1 Tax=Legionella micdadei TaxID=451 RepID=A0A098GDP6_LEGMI|nr:hypothetical protein [Legionella micdadei]ARG96360.1 hypothetical protein B6N58_00920 [Legionella micdadei]ARG99110.1 hypothetical protein B6V88_00915 [Legionella micdadei]KTD29557.1 hypothetical protein Lmic_0629 [Legionella micdadei]NSL18046.1 hypothetical protein [Legionella micdadei]CEG59561.1 conserved exported protein of unknown function [Legionella micdadei]
MKKAFFVILLMIAVITPSVATAGFTLCKSKFALCTSALCESIPNKKGFVSCHCDVTEGYSAGTKPCTGAVETSKGQTVSSRYSPIKAYVVCKNDRPWAWCLDSPCLIDKTDPKKASCLCSVVKNKGPYVIVTESDNNSACTQGLYSSATVKQVTEVTDFLKKHKELPPFPIKVLNGQ